METTNFCIFVLLFEFLFYQLGESKTHSMPCCLESIGSSACMEMKRRRPMEFEERCKSDADFGMLQCCATCETEVAKLGKDLFADGKRSRHCFDRHNKKFCLQFLYQMGMWSGNTASQMSCNGESATLAFRICRRTCGFCEYSLYEENHKPETCPDLTNRSTTTPPPRPRIGGTVPPPKLRTNLIKGRKNKRYYG